MQDKFWLRRTTVGRPALFNDPAQLWLSCLQYFEDCVNNPLTKEEIKIVNGVVERVHVEQPTAFTIASLCMFIGMTVETWHQYKKKPNFSEVCHGVQDIITTQRLRYGLSGHFNSNLVAKLEGLVEKSENVNHNVNSSHEEWLDRIAKDLNKQE